VSSSVEPVSSEADDGDQLIVQLDLNKTPETMSGGTETEGAFKEGDETRA